MVERVLVDQREVLDALQASMAGYRIEGVGAGATRRRLIAMDGAGLHDRGHLASQEQSPPSTGLTALTEPWSGWSG